MDRFDWIMIGIVSTLVGLLVIGTVLTAMRYGDLREQCLADGYKDWECSAMLHGGGKR
jgi:hypothetical protein